MSGLMNRTFSRREKALLLLLVLILIVGLYFFLVYYPIANRLEEIDLETEDVLLQTDVAKARLETYNEMKSELDKIFAMPEDSLTVMPEYDNVQALMDLFNAIFDGTEQSLSFDAVRFSEDNRIAERTVRFSFNAQSYAHARDVLTSLTRTGWRCLMDSVSLSPQENGSVEDGALRVSGSITFYERVS